MSRRFKNKTKELKSAELKIRGEMPVLLHKQALNKVVDGLKWCCEKRGLRIYNYCILPNRILLISDAAWGSVDDTLHNFMDFSAKAVLQLMQFQRNSPLMDLMLTNMHHSDSLWEEDPNVKVLIKQEQHDEVSRRIVNRPVDLGWVSKAEHYLLCSEHPKNPLQGWIVEGIDPWS